jgi:hypothetical protein
MQENHAACAMRTLRLLASPLKKIEGRMKILVHGLTDKGLSRKNNDYS